MATRRSPFPASPRSRLERRSCAARARSFALAIALVAAAAAGDGCRHEAQDPDEALAERVGTAIGLHASVRCERETCRVRAIQPLATTGEAWFIALPVVSGVNSDPALAPIRKLDVVIADQAGTHEAHFACSLRHADTGSGIATVALVHELCRASFSGF